jgi:hypothetical protein
MKKLLHFNIKTIFSVAAVITILWACEKSLDRDGTELDPLVPAKVDDDAGTWKPFILQSATEVPLTAPEAVTSSSYQSELAAVKTAVANITDDQRVAIRYWAGGGILRWNQIMRSLVAKRNLPPAENNSGEYPIPNAANPNADPMFPFANPPYASRSYAYVSVAQYDALVAAMAYKQLYKRKAPYQVDATIAPVIVTKSTLPSFPSEDAVMAAVTYEMMKRLFPATEDTLFLYKKKEEQKWYKLWAGASTKSDIEAGEKLGKAIATKVLARFTSDGMRNAIGVKAQWDSLAKRVEEKGEVAWVSLENAPRPPMLPFFGNVKTWNMDFATLKDISTKYPPLAYKSEEFKKQVAEVKEYVTTKATRENIAIVHFWADGAGTYTPPGHWNAIAANYVAQEKQSEFRAARSFALLNSAMMDAAISCWYTKSYYYFPRPSQADPSIKTLTGVPNFPAYSSGHSTFSAAASTVLSYLFPSDASKFDAMAKEASMSRLMGGIHYRMDCEYGLKYGQLVGERAVLRGKADGLK